MAKPRVLLVGPGGPRSGVPVLLLHLTRWMRAHTDYQLSAVMMCDGPTVEDFAAEMPVRVMYPVDPPAGRVRRWWRRRPWVSRRRLAAHLRQCREIGGPWPPDVIYSATAAVAGVVEQLNPGRCPVVTGVHELEYVLQRLPWVEGGPVPAMARHTTQYVAGSRAVATNLTGRHGVAADRVTVVHDFIDTAGFPPPPRRPPDPSLLAAAGVPAGACVVGSLATVEWRKGSDLVVPLMRLMPPADAAGRPVHFVWVGGGDPRLTLEFRLDVEAAGMSDRVHLVGPTARTVDWYPAFDVLAMLSREDPFPLVMLEAAATGLPAVCFAGSGGIPEFVEDDAGRIVPYLDLTAFAAALMAVAGNADLRDRLGQRAAEKVRARHDVSVAAPAVVAVLEQARAATGTAV